MPDNWKTFKQGLFWGMGFFCSYGLLMLIVWLINKVAGQGPIVFFGSH